MKRLCYAVILAALITFACDDDEAREEDSAAREEIVEGDPEPRQAGSSYGWSINYDNDGSQYAPGSCPYDDEGDDYGELPPTDLPGVRVLGTDKIGDSSILVEITTAQKISFVAGTWFQPKEGEEGTPFAKNRPQRMMIAADILLAGPGSFKIDANCMEHTQAVPPGQSEYYSSPMQPTTARQLCQRDCGDVQICLWDCEVICDAAGPEEQQHVGWPILHMVDNCDDGLPVFYRLFDQESGEAWPQEGTYETLPYGVGSKWTFLCGWQHVICLGGMMNGSAIGVGLKGTDSAEGDWCFTCGTTPKHGWIVGCSP
jgi:hypothetical protein